MNESQSANNYLAEIRQLLTAGKNIWLDAGNGTELQARGAEMHPQVWCGVAHVDYPDIMRGIHADNIKAGANIICLLYTSPSPRDRTRSRMPSSA